MPYTQTPGRTGTKWFSLCVASFLCVLCRLPSAVGQDRVFTGPCQTSAGQICRSPVNVHLLIGGLLPIRGQQESMECEDTLTTSTISMWQGAEAIRFAVDRINDAKFLPFGVRLGYEVYDGCGRTETSLKKSLDFIQAAEEEMCENSTSQSARSALTRVIGVVGAFYSAISEPVSDLLRLFRIPMVSPASTSAALDDKCRHPLFFRTIPSDSLQAGVLVALANKNGWRYISIVHTQDAYGINGANGFHSEALAHGICIAVKIGLPPQGDFEDDAEKKEEQFNQSFNRLLLETSENGQTFRRAKVVLLWMVSIQAEAWLKSASENEAMRSAGFTFLAVSGWSQSIQAVKSAEVARGAIGVFATTASSVQLEEHFERLSLTEPEVNPWLERVYREIYDCHEFPGCENMTLGELHRRNNDGKSLAETSSLVVYLPRIVDAVYAIAYALNTSLPMVCEDVHCETPEEAAGAMRSVPGREIFIKQLRKVYTFNTITNTTIGFASGNPLTAIYKFTNVVHKESPDNGTGMSIETTQPITTVVAPFFHNTTDLTSAVEPITSTSAGRGTMSNKSSSLEIFNQWQEHSGWFDASPAIAETDPSFYCDPGQVRKRFNSSISLLSGLSLTEPFLYHDNTTSPPVSVCSDNCTGGKYADISSQQRLFNGVSVSCCWTCKQCPANSHTRSMFERCISCANTTVLSLNHTSNSTSCIKLQTDYWKLSDPLGGVFISLVSVTFIVMVVIIIIFCTSKVGEAESLPLGKEFSVYVLAAMAVGGFALLSLGSEPTTNTCLIRILVWSLVVLVPLLPTTIYTFYQFALVHTVIYTQTMQQLCVGNEFMWPFTSGRLQPVADPFICGHQQTIDEEEALPRQNKLDVSPMPTQNQIAEEDQSVELKPCNNKSLERSPEPMKPCNKRSPERSPDSSPMRSLNRNPDFSGYLSKRKSSGEDSNSKAWVLSRKRHSSTMSGSTHSISTWHDVSSLVRDKQRRRRALLAFLLIVITLLTTSFLFSTWTVQQKVTPHRKHVIWCSVASLGFLTSSLAVILIFAIGVMGAIAGKKSVRIAASFRLASTMFLRTTVYFASSSTVFVVAFIAIYFSLASDSNSRVPVLFLGTYMINLTQFVSIFATRLYYLSRHKEFAQQQQMLQSDLALCQALSIASVRKQSLNTHGEFIANYIDDGDVLRHTQSLRSSQHSSLAVSQPTKPANPLLDTHVIIIGASKGPLTKPAKG